MENKQPLRCWYCNKRKRKNDQALFCSKCESIKIKETVRPGCENAQRSEFGKGTRGLGV